MTKKKQTKPTEEQVWRYIIDHAHEDFPLDQTLEDFYQKVIEYNKMLDEDN